MDTLPAIPISYSSSGKNECRTIENTFGDGYNQRAADGLNTIAQTWEVTWEDVPTADIDTLEAFFVARYGVIAFLWTPPRQTVAKKWTCKTWSREPINLPTDRLRATFVQRFDL